MKKVILIQDNKCHWYAIPNELSNSFVEDEQNEDFDNDKFEDKYGQYRTGGLNLVQLYVESNTSIEPSNHCEECSKQLESGTVFCSADCRIHYHKD